MRPVYVYSLRRSIFSRLDSFTWEQMQQGTGNLAYEVPDKKQKGVKARRSARAKLGLSIGLHETRVIVRARDFRANFLRFVNIYWKKFACSGTLSAMLGVSNL